MPKTKRPKPLYQRGDYALYRRADRTNLEIVWYDATTRRERGVSTGSSDVAESIKALDRKYLGQQACPTCGRQYEREGKLVVTAIADYLTIMEGKPAHASAGYRLKHVLDYVIVTNPSMPCAMVNEKTADDFRGWMAKRPYTMKNGKTGLPSLSHIEGCLMQLKAAIRATGEQALFKVQSLRSVAQTPQHRSSVKELASMFAYAMERPTRINLLRYLRAAVATMARPDAVMDISTQRRQWASAAKVLNLNPEGRRQTKKYRPTIPIAKQFAPHLDACANFYIPVDSVRSEWSRMAKKLCLPSDGEAGMKLIRRSMATLLRNRMGEQYMPQIERMLGHRQVSMTDIYALASPSQLGAALAEIEAIIDEIEKLSPGAFSC